MVRPRKREHRRLSQIYETVRWEIQGYLDEHAEGTIESFLCLLEDTRDSLTDEKREELKAVLSGESIAYKKSEYLECSDEHSVAFSQVRREDMTMELRFIGRTKSSSMLINLE